MKKINIKVVRGDKPATGLNIILADPFNKKYTIPKTGVISVDVADDFATILNVRVKGDKFIVGTQLEIDVSEKLNYEIEV